MFPQFDIDSIFIIIQESPVSDLQQQQFNASTQLGQVILYSEHIIYLFIYFNTNQICRRSLASICNIASQSRKAKHIYDFILFFESNDWKIIHILHCNFCFGFTSVQHIFSFYFRIYSRYSFF